MFLQKNSYAFQFAKLQLLKSICKGQFGTELLVAWAMGKASQTLQLPFTFGLNTDGVGIVNFHLYFHVDHFCMKISCSLALALKGTIHAHTGH